MPLSGLLLTLSTFTDPYSGAPLLHDLQGGVGGGPVHNQMLHIVVILTGHTAQRVGHRGLAVESYRDDAH